MILAQLSWPEIASDLHLSLWTGTAILSDIARWIEQRLSDKVLLAPPQSAGFYHARFGCLNLDLNTCIGFIGGIRRCRWEGPQVLRIEAESV